MDKKGVFAHSVGTKNQLVEGIMAEEYHQVYQFRIALEGIKPDIWRRIQVPETYSFWDLHIAIQDSMGWEDQHLHIFKMVNPTTKESEKIGVPEDIIGLEATTLPGWKIPLPTYFSFQNNVAQYSYDFGDNWHHEVVLEEILPIERRTRYPRCVDGERACPPEDCGGIWGYERILEVVKDPNHEEFKDLKRWLGRIFKPEEFRPEKVRFSNPRTKWKNAFGTF